jgi:hypothetical protein
MTSKDCGCGRTFDEATWAELPVVGTMDGFPAEGDEPAIPPIELRNCPCGSTIAVELEESTAVTAF